MKKITLISFLFLPLLLVAKEKITLSGFITDAETGEPLINATVSENGGYTGVASNSYGFFVLRFNNSGNAQIRVSYVGYRPQTVTINLVNDSVVYFRLEKGIEMDEIVVRSEHTGNLIDNPETGVIEMNASVVDKLPGLLGEKDLARMVQLMPGVQSGKEGSGGLYVRGGSNDQNLILLDGMPIYNANHIGGFVSIFNPSSVSYLKLYKGGFPAKYGGRLSSVLDVTMKNGSLHSSAGSYSIGTLTGTFSYEGPIKKDTSSFIISGRRTIYDLFVSAYNYLNTNGKFNGGYNLWDLNVKYNKILNSRTRVYISFYKGKDQIFRTSHDKNTVDDTIYNLSSRYSYSWGNTVASVRLNKVYSGKTFVNYTVGVSNYRYEIGNKVKIKNDDNFQETSQSSFYSSITDYLFLADYESVLGANHNFRFGLQTTLHRFAPANNKSIMTGQNVTLADTIWGAEKSFVPELAAYISDDYRVTTKLSANLGLRLVSYMMGNNPVFSFEPRIVGNYKLTRNAALKFSFSQMSQFTHLISTSDQALPSDFWLPSTNLILPERSTQYSLGTFVTIQRKREYEFSFDMYYKSLKNLIEPKGGTSFYGAGEGWKDQLIVNGKGYVLGGEILFKKTTGKTTGWIAYTLSKNMRKFSSINNNEWFPFRFDRRHELTVVLTHEINDHINFSATWVFMSGQAVTLAQYKYLINTLEFDQDDDVYQTFGEAFYYNGRNSFRTPPYHRLDFCFNFIKKKVNGTRTWTVGLYNAYNNLNSYYLFIGKNAKGETKLFSYTLFPIIPSISYSFKF